MLRLEEAYVAYRVGACLICGLSCHVVPQRLPGGQWGVECGGVLSWGAAWEWVSAVCAIGEDVLFDSLWECGIQDESHGGGVWGVGAWTVYSSD